ncbi:MFS transporter [Arcobacter sp. 31_11_sub10_T18]|nr:MFS transporter [Arcobacter sp. 31_11_sub10_T18]
MNYRELLKTYPTIRNLSIVQFIAYFGAWFSNVAIYSMLVDFGASSFLIALVTAAHFLPAVLMAPFSGAFIDRIKLKSLMVILLCVELSMTLLFITVTSLDDVWFLMILIFIRMGAASMFFSAEMSLIPKLIDGEALQKANEIHSIIWSFTYAAGMAVSGVIVNLWGVRIAFIIDACFFIIALAALFRISFDVEIHETKEKLFDMIKEGFNYIKENKIIIHLILLHSSVGLTAFDTLVTLLADYNYKFIIAVPLAIGISNAVRAFALMVGPFFIGNKINKNNLHYLLILQGVSIIAWAVFQHNFYLALIGLFLSGYTTTTLWSYTYALLQKKIEPKYMGRVIAYNDMIFMLTNIVTTLFIGLMASFISLELITILIGFAFFATAYYYTRIKQWI